MACYGSENIIAGIGMVYRIGEEDENSGKDGQIYGCEKENFTFLFFLEQETVKVIRRVGTDIPPLRAMSGVVFHDPGLELGIFKDTTNQYRITRYN
jgi:hypothetical protein